MEISIREIEHNSESEFTILLHSESNWCIMQKVRKDSVCMY